MHLEIASRTYDVICRAESSTQVSQALLTNHINLSPFTKDFCV